MNKLFFSIILPTFNRLDALKKISLPSIEKQTFLGYELIVIDDFSYDGTELYFKSKEFIDNFNNLSKHLTYIKNKRNLGSPSSRNVGFTKADSNWIFMIEDDLEIRDSFFLEKAFHYINKKLKEDNSIAIFCPKREEYSKGYYKNFNNIFINYGFLSKEIYHDPTIEYEGYVENAHACTFIKTKIAKQIKYDDANYKYFREESDFYERIKKIGYKIYYFGSILKTYHRMDLIKSGGNKKYSISLKNEVNYILGHYIYVKKNFRFAGSRIIFFIFVRAIKNFSNLTNIKLFKDFLSFLKL